MQQRRRDVVGQVGDDLARRGDEGGDVRFERVAFDDRQPAGKRRFELAQRGDAARVALDRGDMLGAFEQQRPRQPAGAGADLDDARVVERRRRRARCAASG